MNFCSSCRGASSWISWSSLWQKGRRPLILGTVIFKWRHLHVSPSQRRLIASGGKLEPSMINVNNSLFTVSLGFKFNSLRIHIYMVLYLFLEKPQWSHYSGNVINLENQRKCNRKINHQNHQENNTKNLKKKSMK